MEGIRKICYLIEQEAFELEYLPATLSFDKIVSRIREIGRKRNLPYKAYRTAHP